MALSPTLAVNDAVENEWSAHRSDRGDGAEMRGRVTLRRILLRFLTLQPRVGEWAGAGPQPIPRLKRGASRKPLKAANALLKLAAAVSLWILSGGWRSVAKAHALG